MATFFGGEQLNRRLVFKANLNNPPNITIYTCPTGRYATLFIRRLDASEFTTGADMRVEVDNVSMIQADFNVASIRNNHLFPNGSPESTPGATSLIQIDAGQQLVLITQSVDNLEYDFVIMEYLLP